MTIMATHFAIVLGAWRLRIRIDIDEPRESELHDASDHAEATNTGPAALPHFAARGRG